MMIVSLYSGLLLYVLIIKEGRIVVMQEHLSMGT